LAQKRGFVKGFFIVTRLGRAGHAHPVAFGQFKESRLTQIREVLVPDDDLFGWLPGGEEAFDDGFHDRWTCTAGSPRRGKYFDADGVLCGDQTAPRFVKRWLAGKLGQPALNDRRDFFRLRTEGDSGIGFLRRYHARTFGRLAARRSGAVCGRPREQSTQAATNPK